ncbi:putative tellurite resistance protein B-like protein [Sinobacterium caligoides]|uniref:Putative tellurite resistance protein B-like protein n=1 Tax=Sinobacterium caligoides TaxID=933926 RepID=A0A3N2DZE9_9GAMM|nr:TerB family tellurite resistance protein [Sinobacterium caligoides]ROS04809.1 putative tellurite resistance protein B-like protein [Sinobacterium caligoides]
MLKRLVELFTQPSDATAAQDSIEIAACALLLELVMADDTVEEAEVNATKAVMQKLFELDEQRLEEINAIAQERQRESADLYSFTKLVTEHYGAEQRRQFMFCMWQIAYADKHLDKHEESLIRKISELISVPHSVYIQTKLEAEKQLSNDPS